MESEKEIDKSLVLEVLRNLSKYKDKTLRQITLDLQMRLRHPISTMEVYELLRQMSDIGLVEHTTKMVRLDVYSITEKGLQLINPNSPFKDKIQII